MIQISKSGVEDYMSWGGGRSSARPIKWQVMAGECLAVIEFAVGHIVGSLLESGKDGNQISDNRQTGKR